MPSYFFSVHNDDRSRKEDLGSMLLKSDDGAYAYAKLVILDLMREDSGQYAGWIMDIHKNKRLLGAMSCNKF